MGKSREKNFGEYFCFGPPGVRDSSGSSAVINVYDHAASPFDFTNDPNGDTQFKATILHEMIHALQIRRDQYSIYDKAYKSPLLQTYMDATTPLNAVDTAIWENGWTYLETRGSGNWKLWSTAEDKPPTDYGLTDPKELAPKAVVAFDRITHRRGYVRISDDVCV
ncbi:MAG: hypothetical protein NTW99_07070 [Chloroflexi bacterium]|nr:hypothetical protein [Chloroflexota bacterium]